MSIDLNHGFAWSDSTIVLHWLDGSSKRFKTFVGNRVSAILELLEPGRTYRQTQTLQTVLLGVFYQKSLLSILFGGMVHPGY